MKETDLGKTIIEWLEKNRPDWKIYQELSPRGGKVADIVCVLKDLIWIIELKTTLSLNVIRQAYKWDVDFRTIAFPRVESDSASNNHQFWIGYLGKEMNISSMTVSKSGHVQTHYLGEYSSIFVKHSVRYDLNNTQSHWISTKKRLFDLINTGLVDNYGVAGTRGGGYWTRYKQSMLEIKEYLAKNPKSSGKQIIDALGSLHYAHERSALQCICRNLQTIEKWCVVEKGSYNTPLFSVRSVEE